MQHRIEQRIAEAHRRAEEAWRAPGEPGDRCLRGREVAPQARQQQEGKGMLVRAGMVLDRVPAAHDLARELGMSRRLLRDAEEGRACAVRLRARRARAASLGVGAVVEGERDLAARARASGRRGDVRAQRRLRDHRPMRHNTAWLATTRANHHSQACGAISAAAAAPRCRPIEPWISAEGRQRAAIPAWTTALIAASRGGR